MACVARASRREFNKNKTNKTKTMKKKNKKKGAMTPAMIATEKLLKEDSRVALAIGVSALFFAIILLKKHDLL